MIVGMYAPLPPAPSGVADYAATLLTALERHGSVAPNPARCDLALYHVGNNPLHRGIYQRALAHPGVVVLHDAVLQHFLLSYLDEAAYIAEFVYNHGEWSRGLAQDLWNDRARSAADPRYFAYPMLRRITETARAVIVHNPAAARAVRTAAPRARVIEIPHLWSTEWGQPFKPAAVLPRGVPETPLIAGVFGYLRESKRLPSILRAVEQAAANIQLVIAGPFVSPDLERALAPWRDKPHVHFNGHLPEADWWQQAAAVDICINLRFPSAGETSGIGVRLMGLGKPVIFTAGPELARLPENACLRLPADALEEKTLAGYLRWLAADRQAVREIGRRAAEHIASQHSLDRVAEMYWLALKTS